VILKHEMFRDRHSLTINCSFTAFYIIDFHLLTCVTKTVGVHKLKDFVFTGDWLSFNTSAIQT
jgi:hypothetical protein